MPGTGTGGCSGDQASRRETGGEKGREKKKAKKTAKAAPRPRPRIVAPTAANSFFPFFALPQ